MEQRSTEDIGEPANENASAMLPYVLFILANASAAIVCLAIPAVGYSEFGQLMGRLLGGAFGSLTFNDPILLLMAVATVALSRTPLITFIASVVFIALYQIWWAHFDQPVFVTPRGYWDGFFYRLYGQWLVVSAIGSVGYLWRKFAGRPEET